MKRALLLLLFSAACRPTSILELEIFIGSNVLEIADGPVGVWADLGDGHGTRMIHLCQWPDLAYQETALSPVEFAPCSDAVTITGVVAPIPEGMTCVQGREVGQSLPDEDTWLASATLEAFGEACSVIETRRLTIDLD